MTTTHRHPHYQYWPFPISDLDMELPEEMEGVKFLESAYSEGFEAYREPPNQIDDYYVARSESRIGTILQRGRRNRWEIVLTEGGEKRFKAYVTEFRVAGEEVRKWLKGVTVSEILENITGYLAVLGGSQSSYKVYEVEQYWPFPVSEEDRQRPEDAEKIEFFESVYADGFKVYRICEEQVRYTAISQSLVGDIQAMERGNCWRLTLSGDNQQLMAFVIDFKVAGAAVRACLHGRAVSDILEDIKEYLTIPPKYKFSYKLD
jgi:predicted SpoU family rRNA methylase